MVHSMHPKIVGLQWKAKKTTLQAALITKFGVAQIEFNM